MYSTFSDNYCGDYCYDHNYNIMLEQEEKAIEG